MTLQEWLACTDPERMLEYLAESASERKLRLFAVGCCRRFWHLLDLRSKEAILTSERTADWGRDEEACRTVQSDAHEAERDAYVACGGDENNPSYLGACAASDVLDTPRAWDAAETVVSLTNSAGAEYQVNSVLIRDIFGSLPFRPVVLSPVWLTSTVVSLAQAVYTDRAFQRLPILADALEEAGCTSSVVLEHMRAGGEHVRGCWALDLVLGKG